MRSAPACALVLSGCGLLLDVGSAPDAGQVQADVGTADGREDARPPPVDPNACEVDFHPIEVAGFARIR